MEYETLTKIDVLLGLWKHECTRVIADRFTNSEDKEFFEKCINKLFLEDFGDELSNKLPEEPYFVDFLRDPPEATGDEGEDAEVEAPKIYEPVSYNSLFPFLSFIYQVVLLDSCLSRT